MHYTKFPLPGHAVSHSANVYRRPIMSRSCAGHILEKAEMKKASFLRWNSPVRKKSVLRDLGAGRDSFLWEWGRGAGNPGRFPERGAIRTEP